MPIPSHPQSPPAPAGPEPGSEALLLASSSLADPDPPVPGGPERAAVASRARHLRRRTRVLEGAGALAAAAAVAVLVVVLAGGGGAGTTRVQVAGGSSGAVAPATASVSGTVVLDPGTRLHLELSGDGGNYATAADAAGHFAITGIAPGTYTLVGTFEARGNDPSIGTAERVVRTTVDLAAGTTFEIRSLSAPDPATAPGGG